MNYRKFYCQSVGIENLDRSFHVHHIDLNKTNHEIINLVAIPGALHGRYHLLMGIVEPHRMPLIPPTTSLMHGNGYFDLFIDEVHKFHDVYKELQAWISYRDHLLLGVPNYNKLSYEVTQPIEA